MQRRAGIVAANAPDDSNEESAMTNSLVTISLSALTTVCGGKTSSKGSFDAYVDQQRELVRPAYKFIVAKTAGVKGGSELAKTVYGTHASDDDKIRGAKMIENYVESGTRLPVEAPGLPF
jgi:hypothetical protein